MQTTETTTVFPAEGDLNTVKIVGRTEEHDLDWALRNDSQITAARTH